MTLQQFKDRVLTIGVLITVDTDHLPTLSDIIYADREWHQKWATAMKGRFDA